MEQTCRKRLSVIALLFLISGVGGCVSHQISHKEGKTQAVPVLDTHFETSLIIPVTINNKNYKFIVDTGASLTVIDKKIAEKLTRPMRPDEIPPDYREALSGITAVNGVLEQKHYTLVKPVPFFIGSEEIRDNDVWIAADTILFSQALGTEISGFIGIDTIRKLNWQVDNNKKRLLLTKDAPSAHNWQRCAGYDDSYNRSPLLWLTYGNEDVGFRVDTGASGSYVGKEFIEFAKKQKGTLVLDNPVSRNGDIIGNYNSPLYILKGLKFSNMPLGELKVSENPNQLYAVGMDFLSRFTRYAFIPSRMTFCYDVSSIERYGLASQRSLSIRYTGRRIELFYNSDDNLKDTGLRNGDILLKINGTAYPPAQIDKVREILELTPKGKLTLTIQRGTQRQEVHL